MDKIINFLSGKGFRRLLFLISIICILLGGYLFWTYFSYQNYVEIEAKVFRVELTKEGYTKSNGIVVESEYDVFVRYTVNGTKYESKIGGLNGFQEKDRITIHYNPNNPNQLSQPLNISTPIILCVGGVVLFVLLILTRKKKPKVKQQVANMATMSH